MLDENELDIQLSPNYSPGRQGCGVENITFHHCVGSAASAVSKFASSASQTSSHFVVAPDKVYCCVDTDNTAWTNGNWDSNIRSVTIEHEGNWQWGFRDEGVIEQSARLVAWLRVLYPNASPNRHRDVASTACCCDLPVEEIWDRASNILNPVAPPPAPIPVPPPANQIKLTDINNQTLTTNKKTNLYDLNTLGVVKAVDKGVNVLISATATVNGELYYLTEYSYSKGINNGFKAADFKVEPEPIPVPPNIVVLPVEPPAAPPPVYNPTTPPKPVEPPVNAPTSNLWDSIMQLFGVVVDWLKTWHK